MFQANASRYIHIDQVVTPPGGVLIFSSIKAPTQGEQSSLQWIVTRDTPQEIIRWLIGTSVARANGSESDINDIVVIVTRMITEVGPMN